MMSDTFLISLEELKSKLLPVHLDGAQGIYRNVHHPCLIEAKNDIEAIECWLKEYTKSAGTQRNYRKDAERLLLWSIIEKQKPLSSLSGNDLLDYSRFLEDPQPRERWCGPRLSRKGKRWSHDWRPFVNPLNLSAKDVAFRNLMSLFKYLVEVNYLSHNPVMAVRRQIKQSFSQESYKWQVNERIIDLEDWALLQEILNQYPETKDKERWEKIRLRYILALFYFAGLRVHEAVQHTMSAFRKYHDWQTGKDRWWLYIKGKGGQVNKIPVNENLFEELVQYRRWLKLSEHPEPDEIEPLIRSERTKKAITDRRINQLLKTLIEKIAIQLEEKEQLEKAQRFRKFSAHWLRHLFCSVQDRVGIDRQQIKENARHKSMQTTEIYLHAFDNERHDEMQKLGWKPETISKKEEAI